MSNRRIVALGASAVLLAGSGAVAVSAGWSAQGSASNATQASRQDWPASSSSPAAAVRAARAAADRDGSRVLTFLEVEDRVADVDVGAPGESPGDYFLFENRLLSADGSRLLGRDSGRCMINIRTFTCDATARIFGKGKIVVSGTFFAENDARIAITGGTGRFDEAGGQLTVTDRPDGNTLLVFRVSD